MMMCQNTLRMLTLAGCAISCYAAQDVYQVVYKKDHRYKLVNGKLQPDRLKWVVWEAGNYGACGVCQGKGSYNGIICPNAHDTLSHEAPSNARIGESRKRYGKRRLTKIQSNFRKTYEDLLKEKCKEKQFKAKYEKYRDIYDLPKAGSAEDRKDYVPKDHLTQVANNTAGNLVRQFLRQCENEVAEIQTEQQQIDLFGGDPLRNDIVTSNVDAVVQSTPQTVGVGVETILEMNISGDMNITTKPSSIETEQSLARVNTTEVTNEEEERQAAERVEALRSKLFAKWNADSRKVEEGDPSPKTRSRSHSAPLPYRPVSNIKSDNTKTNGRLRSFSDPCHPTRSRRKPAPSNSSTRPIGRRRANSDFGRSYGDDPFNKGKTTTNGNTSSSKTIKNNKKDNAMPKNKGETMDLGKLPTPSDITALVNKQSGALTAEDMEHNIRWKFQTSLMNSSNNWRDYVSHHTNMDEPRKHYLYLFQKRDEQKVVLLTVTTDEPLYMLRFTGHRKADDVKFPQTLTKWCDANYQKDVGKVMRVIVKAINKDGTVTITNKKRTRSQPVAADKVTLRIPQKQRNERRTLTSPYKLRTVTSCEFGKNSVTFKFQGGGSLPLPVDPNECNMKRLQNDFTFFAEVLKEDE